MGGAFLLSGLVAAILSAPIFDRVLIYHLAKTVKILLPVLGVMWIGLVFAVKPNNLGGIYAVLVLIASISFILLPVGLELGVEITRNAETSTAVLWSGGNIISFLWVLGVYIPLKGFIHSIVTYSYGCAARSTDRQSASQYA
ncbi:hypothetical protein FRC16_006995 [Serendipita sp. 398]|nr:hypothetical protein FRC16_006995 [Serendipita sp. 398]